MAESSVKDSRDERNFMLTSAGPQEHSRQTLAIDSEQMCESFSSAWQVVVVGCPVRGNCCWSRNAARSRV